MKTHHHSRMFLALIAIAMLVSLSSPPISATVIPTFVAVSAIAASTGADVTITLPATWEPNDIFIVLGWVRDQDDTVSISGYTAITGVPFDRGTTSRYWVFWHRALQSENNPIFDKSGATGDTYAMLAIYRNARTSGSPFLTEGGPDTGTSDPAICTGITQVSQEHTLTVNVLGGEDDNNAAVVTTGNDPRNYVEHYAESATGADGMIAFSEMQKAVIGSPQAFVDFDVANPVGWGCMSLPLAGPIGGSGTNSLIAMTAEGPGANCANGGQKIDSGLDNGDGGGTANDGILQAGEIDATSYICNGAAGANGANGADGPPGSPGPRGPAGEGWFLFVIMAAVVLVFIAIGRGD